MTGEHSHCSVLRMNLESRRINWEALSEQGGIPWGLLGFLSMERYLCVKCWKIQNLKFYGTGTYIRISHGTNVWVNNAQDLIKNGTVKLEEAISTRDDVMNYLIAHGVKPITSFKVMENSQEGERGT